MVLRFFSCLVQVTHLLLDEKNIDARTHTRTHNIAKIKWNLQFATTPDATTVTITKLPDFTDA